MRAPDNNPRRSGDGNDVVLYERRSEMTGASYRVVGSGPCVVEEVVDGGDWTSLGTARDLTHALSAFPQLTHLATEDIVSCARPFQDLPVTIDTSCSTMSSSWDIEYNGESLDVFEELKPRHDVWSSDCEYGAIHVFLVRDLLIIWAAEYDTVLKIIDPPTDRAGLKALARQTFDANDIWGSGYDLAVHSEFLDKGDLRNAANGEYQEVTLNGEVVIAGYNWNEVFG